MSGCVKDLRKLICKSGMNLSSESRFQETPFNLHFEDNNSSDEIKDINATNYSCDKSDEIESDTDKKTKVVTKVKKLTKITHSSNLQNLKSGATSKVHSLKNVKENSRRLKESTKHSLPQHHVKSLDKTCHDSSFEIILDNLDSELVSGWLAASNHKIESLTKWISKSINFCNFCHSWISDFDINNKRDALKREYNLFLEDVWLALLPRVQKNRLMESKLQSLAAMALHEYPERLNGSKENNMFINYLLIITSVQKDFKELLMDVNCKFACIQHAQNVLAIRSFALTSIIYGVMKFYMEQNNSETQNDVNIQMELDSAQTNVKRILEAIRLSYVDVVAYMIKSKHVHLNSKDENDKSLFFHASVENSPTILKYLIRELNDSNGHLVNESSDSGNSPLHVSVNMGYLECVKSLLACPFIDINVANQVVYGSTPLHLAIMHNHGEIAKMLLEKGADPNREIMGMSAIQLARTFSADPSILSLLEHANE